MKRQISLLILLTAAVFVSVLSVSADEKFTIGLINIGTHDDKGWSNSHYDAVQYVINKLGADKFDFIYTDMVWDGNNGKTVKQYGEDLLNQGADFLIFNSDSHTDGAKAFAEDHPDVKVELASSDLSWKEGHNYANLPNLQTYMPQMEYGEMIGGCEAALRTRTGKIGYIGPLINDETRRFANATWLGAKYCWTQYRGKDAKDLHMQVQWIGHWSNIPGVTADPSVISVEMIHNGFDVLIAALDTTEALVEAENAHKAGTEVYAIAYDYQKACDLAPDVCLGSRYYNWGPKYLRTIQSVLDNKFQADFEYEAPNWEKFGDPDQCAIGFERSQLITDEENAYLDQFIAKLAADGSMKLFTGPLNWKDGTQFLADGVEATLDQIWYTSQLLEDIDDIPSQN